MFFLNVYLMIDSQRLIFLDYLKKFLSQDTFETFFRGSIFDIIAFCSEEKQWMFVNYECHSWCNRIGIFSVHLEQEKRNFIQQWISMPGLIE